MKSYLLKALDSIEPALELRALLAGRGIRRRADSGSSASIRRMDSGSMLSLYRRTTHSIMFFQPDFSESPYLWKIDQHCQNFHSCVHRTQTHHTLHHVLPARLQQVPIPVAGDDQHCHNFHSCVHELQTHHTLHHVLPARLQRVPVPVAGDDQHGHSFIQKRKGYADGRSRREPLHVHSGSPNSFIHVFIEYMSDSRARYV